MTYYDREADQNRRYQEWANHRTRLERGDFPVKKFELARVESALQAALCRIEALEAMARRNGGRI